MQSLPTAFLHGPLRLTVPSVEDYIFPQGSLLHVKPGSGSSFSPKASGPGGGGEFADISRGVLYYLLCFPPTLLPIVTQ